MLVIPVRALSEGFWHPDKVSILVEHRGRGRRTDGLGMREMSWWWSVVSAHCGHHCCGVLHSILQWCVLLLGDRSAKEGLETVPQARFLQQWVWLARLGWRVDQSRTADLELEL